MEALDNSLTVKMASQFDAGEQSSSHPRFAANLFKLLREPIVHFLLLGALLFIFYQWRGNTGSGSTRIVVTPGEIERLAAGFTNTWQRPPSESELKGLIDDYVKEEIAVREVARLGLEQNDIIIRRRMRQKFEFLVNDASDAAPVTDAQLQAWLSTHADKFRTQPEFAFRQVYIDPQRHGANARNDAQSMLAKLQAGGSGAERGDFGDPPCSLRASRWRWSVRPRAFSATTSPSSFSNLSQENGQAQSSRHLACT